MQQETATGGVNVESNYRSGYHRTTRPKQYKDKKSGEYVEAEPLPDEEAGAYLMEHRKGWTIYFDEVETWKAIPAEQFKELFLSFNQYAKDFIRKQFPPELWYLQSIYDAKCNSLDRDADKYLDTQILKVLAGRKSAEARAAAAAAKKDAEQKPEEKQPENIQTFDWEWETLESAKQQGYTAYTVLHLYATQNHLWIPTKAICKKLSNYPRLFSHQLVRDIHKYLEQLFQSETNEAVLNNMLSVAGRKWAKLEADLESEERERQRERERREQEEIPPDWWDDDEEPDEEPDSI